VQVSHFRQPLVAVSTDHPSFLTAGIHLEPSTLTDFMLSLTSSLHSHAINFVEFRDFLLLLPRKASTEEIYRYYEVKKSLNPENRSAARLTMEGSYA
jgi:solute carrier family 25 (mitochondrial phosphate transporter), member 23/24/25/41